MAGGQLSNETNRDGYFRLNLLNQLRQDTLVVTTIDYQLAKIPLSTASSTNCIIRLNAVSTQSENTAIDIYFSLDRPFQARDTLLKAVASIAKNYTQKPTLLHGFYRETIEKQEPDFCTSYTEGLIEVYKPSYYFTKKDDQIQFVKGRRKPLTTFSIPVLIPGPWVSNMLDIVKYQEFLFRNGTLNKQYIFTLAGQNAIGNQPVYIIGFRPRTAYATGGYFSGKLFLTIESLAIIRAEYELTEQGLGLLNKSGYAQVYSTTLKKRIDTANYIPFGNHWSFHSGSVENRFIYKSPDPPFLSRVGFVVIRRESENIKPFTAGEQVVYNKLPMQSFDQTDDTFWNGENQLLPTYPRPALIAKP